MIPCGLKHVAIFNVKYATHRTKNIKLSANCFYTRAEIILLLYITTIVEVYSVK